MTALLNEVVAQGPPYKAAELGTFAAVVASFDTIEGSLAAARALVAIARGPESPRREQAMLAVIDALAAVLPAAQADVAGLRIEVLPLVFKDREKIDRAFDVAIASNASLRNPTADYAARVLAGTARLSKVARYAIDKLADANLKTSSGETLLNAAAGNFEAQQLLLARGANPNLHGEQGYTALHKQVAIGFRLEHPLEGIELLLSRGADVSAASRDGTTALHLALSSKMFDTAKTLIVAGADVNAEDLAGKRALTIAFDLQDDDMVQLIRARGGAEAARAREARLAREKYVTRKYSIKMTELGRSCALWELRRVCQRVLKREADAIEVVSNREMRLIFYSGKKVLEESRLGGRMNEPEKYVAVVRDREIVESHMNVQVVDWRNAGCGISPLHGPRCWDESRRLCEKWGSHETAPC